MATNGYGLQIPICMKASPFTLSILVSYLGVLMSSAVIEELGDLLFRSFDFL